MDTPDEELRKLCDKYASFSKKALKADEEWFKEESQQGNIKTIMMVDAKQLVGKIVAVFDQEFVAIGDDETGMRIALSKKYGVHPGRFYLVLLKEHSLRRKTTVIGCSTGLVVAFVLICFIFVAAISALGKKANATFSKIGSSVSAVEKQPKLLPPSAAEA